MRFRVGARVGIDIGGTKMLMVARDGGKLIAETECATGPGADPTELEERIAGFCQGLATRPDRMAIAIPGLVADHRRVVVSDVLPKISGWAPFSDVEIAPVFLINDVRASLACASSISPRSHILSVVVGTAVGAAFTNGEPGKAFSGADGWAGELGYMPVRSHSGEWQRLDELAGGAAILRRLDRSGARVYELLKDSDQEATREVIAAGEALGVGIACCVNLLNPRAVFLGGGTFRFPGYMDAALRTAESLSLPESWAGVEVSRFPDRRRFVADGAVAASRSVLV